MAADANRGYKSVSHLQSYPLISDITASFTSSSICQRATNLSSAVYDRFITPISRVVQSADDFADANLTHLDSRFPVVKEVSAEDVKGMIGYPRKLIAEEIVKGSDYAHEKQEWVLHVYESQVDERKGLVVKLKAGVTTGLVVSADVMLEVADILVTVLKASVPAAVWKAAVPVINGNGAMSDGTDARTTNGTNAMKDRINGMRATRYGTNVTFRGQGIYVIEEWGEDGTNVMFRGVGMPIIEEGGEEDDTDGNGAMQDATNGNGAMTDGTIANGAMTDATDGKGPTTDASDGNGTMTDGGKEESGA
jgi:hypothetical protein